jgi:hypothetical protein
MWEKALTLAHVPKVVKHASCAYMQRWRWCSVCVCVCVCRHVAFAFGGGVVEMLWRVV